MTWLRSTKEDFKGEILPSLKLLGCCLSTHICQFLLITQQNIPSVKQADRQPHKKSLVTHYVVK